MPTDLLLLPVALVLVAWLAWWCTVSLVKGFIAIFKLSDHHHKRRRRSNSRVRPSPQVHVEEPEPNPTPPKVDTGNSEKTPTRSAVVPWRATPPPDERVFPSNEVTRFTWEDAREPVTKMVIAIYLLLQLLPLFI